LACPCLGLPKSKGELFRSKFGSHSHEYKSRIQPWSASGNDIDLLTSLPRYLLAPVLCYLPAFLPGHPPTLLYPRYILHLRGKEVEGKF
jgi:hypothetical protein